MITKKNTAIIFLLMAIALNQHVYGQATLQFSGGEELSLTQEQLESLKTASGTVKGMLEDLGEGGAIPLPLITINDFKQLSEYLKLVNNPKAIENKIKTLPMSTLAILVNNATYLDIPVIVEKISSRIATLLKTDKSIENNFVETGKIPNLESLSDPYVQNKIAKTVLANLQSKVVAKGAQIFRITPKIKTCRTPIFNPDGKKIAILSPFNKAKVWLVDAQNGKLLRKITVTEKSKKQPEISSLDFSPDGTKLLAAYYGKENLATIWDIATGNIVANIKNTTGEVPLFAKFSPDGNKIAVSLGGGTFQLKMFDLTAKELFTINAYDDVESIEFSPDGSKGVYTMYYDDTSHIFDAATGTRLHKLRGNDDVNSALFSPDGKKVVTAHNNNVAIIWDASTGKKLKTLRGHEKPVESAIFSPDSKKIATTSQGQARVWDAATGKTLRILPHKDSVNSANFSPDGTKIITASDTTTKVWNTKTGKLILSLPHYEEKVDYAIFSPDGTKALDITNKCVTRGWNIQSALAINNYLQNKLQTTAQALLLYLFTTSDNPQDLVNKPNMQPIIESLPQELKAVFDKFK